MKKKVAFALLMGIVTTGVVSFIVIAFNVGFISNFFFIWFKSWFIGYFVVIPLILFIAPKIQVLVDRLFKDGALIKQD